MRRSGAPARWNRVTKWAALGTVATALLAGCGNQNSDPLQVTDTLVAATPAASPAAPTPDGDVIDQPGRFTTTTYTPATRTLALATDEPRITILDTTNPAAPPRTVPLPAPATALHNTGTSLLAAVPNADQIVRLDSRTGAVQQRLRVPGGPTSATQIGNQITATLRDKSVAVLDVNGTEQHRVPGFQGPADVVRAGEATVVLDRLDSSVTGLNTSDGSRDEALRAGDGATNAVPDRFGRVLTVDTRSDELMAFSTNPLIMRQRYPVPGSPYGLAYDPHRDLAWVTLPDRNAVVGYNVAAGEPQQRHQFRTVRQPNSVAVDPNSGKVYIGSAAGEGIQVISP